jgi:methylation protein EvaC
MAINLTPVINFGSMPIANAFLEEDQFEREHFYHMILGFDPRTKAIGLVNTVPLSKLFHNHYAFYSSTSKLMQAHFSETAKKLLQYAGKGIVVELGSNDGIMLEAWKNMDIPAIGIEPSKNVAKISQSKGHAVIVKPINNKVVDEVLEKGKVSLVYAANTFCQFANFGKYIGYVTRLIGKDGVFVFEDPYFLDIYEKTAYDQIYDEHVWYFTVSFVNNMFGPFGYHVFDCEHLEVHGGELRMCVGHKDTHPAKESVSSWLKKEEDLEEKLTTFRENTEKSKTKLLEILHKIKKDKKSVCGFGATSKATTVFNYCGIGPDLIPFVTDNTPIKQGKFYPGVHIPVVPQEKFEGGKDDPKKKVDYAFLGAWNHFKEIRQFQSWYESSGGRWITHVPSPRLL